MSNRLGKTIRILRQAKDLNLTQLAAKSGISVAYLSLMENGDRQPSLDVIRRLSKALGIPSEALVMMGMAENSDLFSKSADATALAETVDRLMEIENKLGRLLNTEDTGATKKRVARRHRRSDGSKSR